MKETINANIGQQVFTLDRDAYDRLTIYLNDVRRRITVDTDEVMNDIEIRIAEIFREGLTSSLMVVSLAMVERAIARVGAPEDFGST
ncbi:MAG: PspC family transcriptional regulator, partial [Alistipes sp.]|nr:PspC family transcriptional regulator [Alistipes sp.]